MTNLTPFITYKTMRPLFVEDFAINPVTQLRREIIDDLSRCDWEGMRELHAQNAAILRQHSALEKEMKQQRTVADVNRVKTKAANIQSQVNKNNATILEKLYAFFRR